MLLSVRGHLYVEAKSRNTFGSELEWLSYTQADLRAVADIVQHRAIGTTDQQRRGILQKMLI